MFKRSILIAALTVFVGSLAANANAQLFRCPSGACPSATTYRSVRVVTTPRVYNPYTYRAAQTVAPCLPAVETVETPDETTTVAPCDPVQAVVEPCAPVQTETSCEHVEYIPTETGAICVNGTCPIRNLTRAAVGTAARTATAAVQEVATTARFLLAVNRVRAQYNLPAFKADAILDKGCETQANYCASRGALIHGAGVAEILAQNQSGIDAAIIQWLNSPQHRALMLSPSYRFAGVSVVRGNDGRVWCAMRFR